MKLRKVGLSGFKTFARKTEMVVEPGITAIVGSNGSGKSNIVDAIRWTLGETNARELRGSRMDDVIYSGGTGRAAMSFAEVSLVFENEDGQVPLPDSEIEVMRRITRGGESEYRLNGSRMRLRDIERSLGSTGMLQNGYAVIAQNDIDAIIRATPSQRRALVEQAAGVRGLRAACDEASSKLQIVSSRLLRFDDLLSDATPRLEELREQAKLALEQKELTDRLAELRGSLARESWRAARAQLKLSERRFNAAKSRQDVAASEEADFVARYNQAKDELTTAKANVAAAVESVEQSRLEAERASFDLSRWCDRLASASLQRSTLRAELADAKTHCEQGEIDLHTLRAGASQTQKDLYEQTVKVGELRANRDQQGRELTEATDTLRELELRQGATEHEVATTRTSASEKQAQTLLIEETVNSLQKEIDEAVTHLSELEEQEKAAKDEEAQATEALAQATKKLDVARDVLTAARQLCAQADADQSQARQAASEAGAKAAALRGQMQGVLGAGGAVATAVETGDLVAERLVDLFSVADPTDTRAIEAALDLHLGAWVVENLEKHADLVRGGSGEEILAGHLETKKANAPAGTRWAFDAVDASSIAQGVMSALLLNCWLAPTLETATAAVKTAGGKAVLPDGRVVTEFSLSSSANSGQTLELAQLERDARQIASDVAQQETDAASKSVEALNAFADADDAFEIAFTAEQEAKSRLGHLGAVSAGATTSAERERSRLAQLSAVRAGRHGEAEKARAEAIATEAEFGRANAALAELQAQIESARALASLLRDKAESWSGDLTTNESELIRMQLADDDAQRRLAQATSSQQHVVERLRIIELRQLALETDITVALARSQAARAVVKASAERIQNAQTLWQNANLPVAQAEVALVGLENQRSEIAVGVARASDEFAAASAEVSACQDKVNELAQAVGDAEEEGDFDPEGAEKAEREIVKLERRVGAFGPVNALAPEQFETLDRQVNTVKNNRGDLAHASRDLKALIENLREESERRFEAVFEEVSAHFQAIFSEFFSGGKATLRLEEIVKLPQVNADGEPVVGTEEEEEETQVPGVEILAQPPGKRLQALSLLSGGERALTALALILALQKVKPSPFYLFDEVDAPLDDANVLRFTRMLRRLSQDQQFLVITHNHVTMAAADALYGVAIDGEGVSSLVSVRFQEGEIDLVGRKQAVAVAS